MYEKYLNKRFHKKSQLMIQKCDGIIAEFQAQGYVLTIRQLYYQLVARDVIPNKVQSYDNLVQLMTNARLAGLIDWDAIEDRTRSVIERAHWDDGSEILYASAESYFENMWDDQDCRVFAVVEKEALAGVFEKILHKWDIPLLPARGYPSATTLREFAKTRIMGASQDIVLFHFGDHDPSGIDMSRDLIERSELFSRYRNKIDFRRLALNMDQIEEQKPPPNPAKQTDARYKEYKANYGELSWELDALSPDYLLALVKKEVTPLINNRIWRGTQERISAVREKLTALAEDFEV